ncbi:MAG TPA: hypothetical protein VN608_03715, partial [Clostridia bacterium]|nr:hypothetical protein [Clostridia bacterium]
FPFMMLFLSVFGVLSIIALVVFVGLPKVLPLVGIEYRAPFMPTPSPSPTPRPTPTPNPMDSFDPVEAQCEVIFEGSTSYSWFGDPYFYKGKLMLSAGKIVDRNATMTSLYFYYPDQGRTAELLPYKLKNSHFMFARFNDDFIVYLDAKLDGGGYITVVDLNDENPQPIIIKEVFAGQPELMLDGNYLAWTERTGSRMDKLFVCDLTSRETVAVQLFNNSFYGESKPSLNNGLLLWADLDDSAMTSLTSVICSVTLNGSPSIKTYRPGTYVHDPISNGEYTAWLDGNHGPDTSLYFTKDFGLPVKIDEGVVDFGLSTNFIAYSKNSSIYVYMIKDLKTYRITPETEQAQFLDVSDAKVIWMDVTTRERDIVKFAPIP